MVVGVVEGHAGEVRLRRHRGRRPGEPRLRPRRGSPRQVRGEEQWLLHGLGALAGAAGAGLWFYGQHDRDRNHHLARLARPDHRPEPRWRPSGSASDHDANANPNLARHARRAHGPAPPDRRRFGYDPNPKSGALQCGSSNSCPQDYTCRSGRCWKDGAGGQGESGGTTGQGGQGGSAGAPNIANFVGTWAFNAASSKRTRGCTDGTNEITDAAGTTPRPSRAPRPR